MIFIHSLDHQFKGRRYQFKYNAHRKDGIRIQNKEHLKTFIHLKWVITNEYKMGFRLSARNSFFPNMRVQVRHVLKKTDTVLENGGKPLIMFASFIGCSEDWLFIDFSGMGAFRE